MFISCTGIPLSKCYCSLRRIKVEVIECYNIISVFPDHYGSGLGAVCRRVRVPCLLSKSGSMHEGGTLRGNGRQIHSGRSDATYDSQGLSNQEQRSIS